MACQKRPATDSLNDRNGKRRSSRACLSCRNRKVRCDVELLGSPCTNCRLDDVDCILIQSNRGRRPAATTSIVVNERTVSGRGNGASADEAGNTGGTNNNTGGSDIATIDQTPTAGDSQEAPESQVSADDGTGFNQYENLQRSRMEDPEQRDETRTRDTSHRDGESGDYLVSLSFDAEEISPARPQATNTQGEMRHQDTCNIRRSGAGSWSESVVTITPSDHASIAHVTGASVNRWNNLPSYLRPPSRHISASDMTYLAEKNAFTIPDAPFRDELLNIYVNVVHPFLPAVDLEGFLAPISRNDGNNPISLLLFQAVMFVSVVFADKKVLQRQGFENRRVAREVFFSRVRLLYGLDYETDRLALIQSLLLMTYWFGGSDDVKDTWHWMGIAISLTQESGFHRDPGQFRISASEKCLRRRIWWSCYIRDRLIALGIRRPARLRDDEANVSMLGLGDFELETASAPVLKLVGETSLLAKGKAARTAVAITCIELAKLCVCLGRILHSQYSVIQSHPGGFSNAMKFAVVPGSSEARAKELDRRDAELEAWLEGRDVRCTHTSPSSRPAEMSTVPDKFLRLHKIQLQMVYLTAVGALHRPQVFCAASRPEACNISRGASRQKLRNAAKALNKLVFDLRNAGLMSFLSTSSIPAFLSAAIIHLLDIKSNDEEVSNVSIGRFYHCVQVLHQLQDMYASADYAVRFLEIVLRIVDVKVPVMGLGIKTSLNSRADMFASHAEGTCFPESERHQKGQETAHMSSLLSKNNGSQNNLTRQTDIPHHGVERHSTPYDDVLPTIGRQNMFQAPEQHFVGFPSEPPIAESWNEADSLLPALMNFDVDSSLLDMPDETMGLFDWDF